MIIDEIIMKLVNFTNAKISAFITSIRNTLDKRDNKIHFRLTFLLEFKAYFGLFSVRTALHLNGMDSDIILYHESSIPLFVCAMKRKLFSHFIQFDDVDKRSARWKNDKFACFLDYFKQINIRFLLLWLPS